MSYSRILSLFLLTLLIARVAGAQMNDDMVNWHMPPEEKNNLWFHENKSSDTVFIFVHGFRSDSRRTWAAMEGDHAVQYWPYLVWDDPRLGHPSVFLGGYGTGSNYPLHSAVEELWNGLLANNVIAGRSKVIFVAHSLGGIVVRKMLCDYASYFRSKKVGVALYASPAKGSGYATLVTHYLSEYDDLKHNLLLKTLEQDNDVLDDLDNRFRDLIDGRGLNYDDPPRIKVAQFAEQYFIYTRNGRMQPVVDALSAQGHYGGMSLTIEGSDHFNIVKPQDEWSLPHTYLIQFCQSFDTSFTNSPPSKDVKIVEQLPSPKVRKKSVAKATLVSHDSSTLIQRPVPREPFVRKPLNDNRLQSQLWGLAKYWSGTLSTGYVSASPSLYADRLDGYYNTQGISSGQATQSVRESFRPYQSREVALSKPLFPELRSNDASVVFCKASKVTDLNGRTSQQWTLSYLHFHLVNQSWKITEVCEAGKCQGSTEGDRLLRSQPEGCGY